MQIISTKRIFSTTAIPTTTKSKRQLFLPYGSNDAPFQNQFTQINFLIQTWTLKWITKEILTALNRIADNREINMVSFSVILTVALFLGYIAIDFGLNDGLTLRVSRDLFIMIVAVFILIIA